MTLQDRKELEDRQAENLEQSEDTLWSSQTVEHDVGSDTLYINQEKIAAEEMSLQEALERGSIRGVPVKVRVRNRMSSPVKLQSQNDDRRQLLQMEVIQTQEPVLTAGEAVTAWVRHLTGLLNHPVRSRRVRGYLVVLLTLLLGTLLAVGLLGLL